MAGAVVLGALAAGVWAHGAHQRAADLAALAAARAMRDAYPRVFAPAIIDGRPNPAHLPTAAYLAARPADGARDRSAQRRRGGRRDVPGRRARAAARRGSTSATRSPPARARPARARRDGRGRAPAARALAGGLPGGSGEYRGPLAYRDGKPMRPDVALAYDRMAAAARRDGHASSSAAASARTPSRRGSSRSAPTRAGSRGPAPRCTGSGTELDLGPPSAYAWLAANARRFHFLPRYCVGALALRVLLTCGHPVGRLRRQGRRAALVRAGALRAGVPPGGPALERLRRRCSPRRRAASPGFDPHGALAGRRAGHRAVHARHRARLRPARPVRSRGGDRRPGPPHARPPAHVRLRAARAGRLQRRRRPAFAPACASRRSRRPRLTSPTSSASSPARAWHRPDRRPARPPRAMTRIGSRRHERQDDPVPELQPADPHHPRALPDSAARRARRPGRARPWPGTSGATSTMPSSSASGGWRSFRAWCS